jgi:hypothetical protein
VLFGTCAGTAARKCPLKIPRGVGNARTRPVVRFADPQSHPHRAARQTTAILSRARPRRQRLRARAVLAPTRTPRKRRKAPSQRLVPKQPTRWSMDGWHTDSPRRDPDLLVLPSDQLTCLSICLSVRRKINTHLSTASS